MLDFFEQFELLLLLEVHFKLDLMVKMVLNRPLMLAGDDDDVLDARLDRLFNDVLDRRFVEDRQHLLRHRLRRREEPRSKSCSRNDR